MTARLPEHLDLIATAPEGIRKLRGLILELAVRGKLVPQDPNDEPASELLKRIAKERARLEAEEDAKKAKALPPWTRMSSHLALPDSLEWVRRLGIVSEKLTDSSHRISRQIVVLAYRCLAARSVQDRMDRYQHSEPTTFLSKTSQRKTPEPK